MDCKSTHERLSAYLDRELPQAHADAVEQHVRRCARCAAELAGLRALGSVLTELEGASVPDGFARRVREAALARQADGARRLPVPLFGFMPARVLVRVAAGLIAVAGLGAGLWVGVSLGGSAFEDRALAQRDQGSVVEEPAEEGELEVQMASFSVAPPGSMAEAYLSFVKAEAAGGQER
jgi:anti-sigma factor RsiW